jgi:hypothetical protein
LSLWGSFRDRSSSLLDRHGDARDVDDLRHSSTEGRESPVPEELDVVRTTTLVYDWPVGTEGTVLELFADRGLVEVGDPVGDDFEIVSVPYTDLEVVWRAATNELV